MERDILKKAAAFFAKERRVKFAFIDAEKASSRSRAMCRALGVSRGGLLRLVRDGRRRRARARTRGSRCSSARRTSGAGRRYGSPRVHAELAGRRTIRVEPEAGHPADAARKGSWRASAARFKCTTMSDHDQPSRRTSSTATFAATAPNQRWVGDTPSSSPATGSSTSPSSSTCSRGSSSAGRCRAVNDRHLTIKALDMALAAPLPRRRAPPPLRPGQHRTRARTTRTILEAHGITCSMSRRGNCYDNAAMESWFSTLKCELGERFESYGDAKSELFDYIEVFYNQQRRTRPSATSARPSSNGAGDSGRVVKPSTKPGQAQRSALVRLQDLVALQAKSAAAPSDLDQVERLAQRQLSSTD